ncbi:hypothetical protein CDL15_Pgr024863 [Punica granatum]|uniref:PRP1 splicing factor N-terminal domain-containing protein n=1 Tax=Punica granatum TaxID=22663 RepID=A0A218Y3Z5_PUNGR|nr:hypothetical protein CDL15_Pgr024863 [Punica granatum]
MWYLLPKSSLNDGLVDMNTDPKVMSMAEDDTDDDVWEAKDGDEDETERDDFDLSGRRDRVDDVLERDNLRHLEQRMEQMDQRMDSMMEQLTQQMAALMENQNRENPNSNPNPNPEQEESGEESEGEIYFVEYDSYSEGDVNIFIEEGPSDNAFFLTGGDGEPEFNEDDEEDDKGYDENWKFDEFEGNDMGVFAFAKYDEDDKEVDAVWEAIDKRMDSQRKDRKEARLK